MIAPVWNIIRRSTGAAWTINRFSDMSCDDLLRLLPGAITCNTMRWGAFLRSASLSLAVSDSRLSRRLGPARWGHPTQSLPAQWAGWILSYFPGSVFGKGVTAPIIDSIVSGSLTDQRVGSRGKRGFAPDRLRGWTQFIRVGSDFVQCAQNFWLGNHAEAKRPLDGLPGDAVVRALCQNTRSKVPKSPWQSICTGRFFVIYDWRLESSAIPHR